MKIFDFILDIIFPKFCLGCGREQTYLCASCQKKIGRLDRQRCVICQMSSPFGRTHSDCAKTKLDGVISALTYHDPVVQALVATYKYKFVDLSELLAEFINIEIRNLELQTFFAGFTIIPVPLHQKRLAWRGFNQSQLLAEKIQMMLNAPIDLKLVIRSRHTTPQAELTREQRQTNITGAFEVTRPVSGQNFLLVDDVVTTGSTLNEIARILKKQKAAKVWAITLAAD